VITLHALGWYLSIFLWLYLTGIGLPPCPEEAGIIYAAGVTALQPGVHWWFAWPATILGIVCADATLYGLGWWWGPHLFEHRWVQKLVKPERRRRFEERFHGHGIKILLTARLLPPLRTGVFIMAGAVRFPFSRFLIADGIYAVIGVGVFFFGSAWLIDLLHQVGHIVGHWLVYGVAALVGLFLLYLYYRRLRDRELKGDVKEPISVLEVGASANGDGRKHGAAVTHVPSEPEA
jgi:membrane protein DedA with SNARE-associated domain